MGQKIEQFWQILRQCSISAFDQKAPNYIVNAPTNLQPHYSNVVLGNVYLSAGQQ